MTVEILGTPSLIYMIGESHCLQFSNLMFKSLWLNDSFFCRTRYYGIPAQNYIENDALNPQLTEILESERILLDGHAYYMKIAESAAYLSGLPQLPPAMVFFAGDVDLQNLFAELGNRYDFELPGDTLYGVDFDKEPISYLSVSEKLEGLLRPFLDAMSMLRPLFPRTMVHALPPRSANSDLAQRWSFGVLVDAPLRAKLTLVANDIMASTCAKMDIPFIDLRDQVIEDGYIRADLDLDGLHMGRAAAVLSLEAITAGLYDRTAATGNNGRYELLKALAPDYEGAGHPDAAAWTDVGYVVGDIGTSALSRLAADLQFLAQPANKNARLDWVGYPRAGRPGLAIAEPPDAMIESAARLFCVGAARALLQVGEPKELTVLHFRPVEIAPSSTTRDSVLPTPYGCRRAILCLDRTGSVVQETLDGQPINEQQASAGKLVIYDPARIRCHAAAGNHAARIVEIGLAPRLPNHPFRVISAGLNDWPVDPFTYSVAGLRAFAPFKGDSVVERA
jgi:hypothetical protein